MATGPTGRLIQRLRTAALAHDGAAFSDGELLESFVAVRDDVAFELLVLRHGPMVLGVCRRILGNRHDAEDAFQATFLVLARRAAAVVPRQLVGNWLYGVAYRTASKARAMNARRRVKEGRVREMPQADVFEEIELRDLAPLLDRELQALPDKYRAPIVLCDLEGKRRKDVALLLGWPEGTVSSRLAVGRRMLARKLTRRGLAVSGAGLAVVFTHSAAQAAVPLTLVASTVQAGLLTAAGKVGIAAGVSATVATLADGVLKGMLLAKLKVATAVVLGFGVLLGLGSGLPTDGTPLSEPVPVAQSAAAEPMSASAPVPHRDVSEKINDCAAPPVGRVVFIRAEKRVSHPPFAEEQTRSTIVVVIPASKILRWESFEPVIAFRLEPGGKVWQSLQVKAKRCKTSEAPPAAEAPKEEPMPLEAVEHPPMMMGCSGGAYPPTWRTHDLAGGLARRAADKPAG